MVIFDSFHSLYSKQVLSANTNLKMLEDAQPPEGYDLLHQAQQALVALHRQILMAGEMSSEEILNFIEKPVSKKEHNTFIDKLEKFFVVGLWKIMLYWLFAFWALLILIISTVTLVIWIHKKRKGERFVLPAFFSVSNKKSE